MMAKLSIWETPSDYFGFDPVGDIGVAAKHRDSDALARSNFTAAKASLLEAAGLDAEVIAACDGDDMDARPVVYDWRASHWAVGWVEYLMVRADAPQAVLDEAQAIADALEDYPALDEDDWSQLAHEEASDFWASLSVRQRADYIKDYAPEVSIFAARRDWVPSNDGRLDEVLQS